MRDDLPAWMDLFKDHIHLGIAGEALASLRKPYNPSDDIELAVRDVHEIYPQYSYEQILLACQQIASHHIESSSITLGRVFHCIPEYKTEFEAILNENLQ